ncbi:MAG TPA: cytochrome c [Steroidobacter sp.]|nr:cytochrome c [Steroidobacter sp.]
MTSPIPTARTLAPLALAVLFAVSGCGRQEGSPADRTVTPAPEQSEPAATPPPADAGAQTESAAADQPMAANAAGAADGAKVYQTYCQTCHGAKGEGDGPAAAALNPKPADFAKAAFRLDANGNGKPGDLEDVIAVVRDGAAKHGGSPLMAPWPMLSQQQLQAVAEHVLSMGGN